MNRLLLALSIALTLMIPVTSGPDVSADSHIELVSELPSPQPVGATITWTMTPQESELYDYRLSVSPVGEPLRVMYDFDFLTEFEWTPIEDGEYQIQLAVKERRGSVVARIDTTFVIESRVDDTPIVTPTDHPLVALYSAPPCESGEMRVYFVRSDGQRLFTTNSKPCRVGHSMNFYIAGMQAESSYLIRHEVLSSQETVLEIGPLLEHQTGTIPVPLPSFEVINPANLGSSLMQPVTLHSPGKRVSGAAVARYTVATDFNGEIIWYHQPEFPKGWGDYVTRPLPGGNMLIFEPALGGQGQVLREVDLAGNTVRVTNSRRISHQLVYYGLDPVNGIHHEAVRFPNGQTLIIGAVEKLVEDAQGPGLVNVMGDMIIALDENFQVVWAWNSFDHLDISRKATLNEVCDFCNAPLYRAEKANDWTHSNAIAYSPADGNLILSVRNQDWVIKIDYQDGTGAGDIIWRLGPDGDFTIESDDPYPWFTHQHDANYIGDNQIILYDNGWLRCETDPNPEEDCNSRGQVLNIDEDNMVATLALNVDLGNFSPGYGSAQKLLNGNYSFTSGQNMPHLFTTSDELLPDGRNVFSIKTPDILMYRSFRMESMYAP